MALLTSRAIDHLRESIKGDLIVPNSPGYEKIRQVWNAMIDRRPAVILRCAEPSDVPHAIAFGREHGLETTVRGAGHNIAGTAVCDNGLMIDFSPMKNVQVDAANRRAHVDAGATLGDFDTAVQAHGLATPVGINSTTGIAGLTIGGGFGWLTRKYGMTIDNLVSAQVVTAEGETLQASETENEDLFWAIRGGGGNFGVVTRFEFQLHPVGPEILAGLLVFPCGQAKQVLEKYREFAESAPEELVVWTIVRQAPPLPFLPEEVHGKEVLILAVFCASEIESGQKLLAPLRDFGNPLGEHIGPQPYVAWQQAFDPLLTPGARNYWKSHNFTALNDGVFNAMIEFGGKLPSPQCEIFIGLIAGAPNRVPGDATAYTHRDARFVLNVHGRWDTPNQDAGGIEWARGFFKATQPYASAGAYTNFMTGDESSRIAAAYGSNYGRLVEIKRKYDPTNFFRHNQNIKP